jgi:uncharacterized protein YodC (DUF2158 family)
MSDEIKVGDTVKLKSGGPTMTVDWVSRENPSILVAGCSWFDDSNKKQFERFPLTSLVGAAK